MIRARPQEVAVHRSRLAAIGIDVPAELFDTTAAFWAGALGREPSREPPDDPYIDLGRHGGQQVFVQLIGEPSRRLHLDIETDDVEAEVARLEQLGATKVTFIEDGWWIMRDPAGNLFCVLPAIHPDFPAGAAEWS
jgi:hypothetical protein